jgi:hypothetical protein
LTQRRKEVKNESKEKNFAPFNPLRSFDDAQDKPLRQKFRHLVKSVP